MTPLNCNFFEILIRYFYYEITQPLSEKENIFFVQAPLATRKQKKRQNTSDNIAKHSTKYTAVKSMKVPLYLGGQEVPEY